MKGQKKPSKPQTKDSDYDDSSRSKNQVKYRGPKKEFSAEKDDHDHHESAERAKPNFTRNLPIKISYGNFVVRTIWTVIMLLAFITIISAGHVYCAIFVLLLNIGMVREIMSLKRNHEKEVQVPFSFKINWYFFTVAVIYFYGKLFANKLPVFTMSNPYLYAFVKYHNFICFCLWVFGFLLFVLTLKKGFYKYQFRMFAWVHICVFLIVGQSAAIINNIYEGLIWFVLPCLFVISNDTFAYIFGFFLGKTKLIELSPKKTWEGFIGGSFSTVIVAVILAKYLSHYEYLVCPQDKLTFVPFSYPTCDVSEIFQVQHYHFESLPFWNEWNMSEFQIHAVILALFASLVSPFGGFFASGFKRAIKVKDFAEIIPGHGGITDRMDCQIMTGMFVNLYVSQIVYGKMSSVNGIIRFITSEMASGDQIALYNELKEILLHKGLLNITMKSY